MMANKFLSILVSSVAIISTGCSLQSADRIAGYTEPGIGIEYNQGLLGGGGKLVVSSKLNGSFDAEYDPETKSWTRLSGKLDSDPEPIYDAQARRINENFLALRDMETQLLIQQQQIAAQSIKDILAAVTSIADRYGPTTATSIMDGISNMVPSIGIDAGTITELLKGVGKVPEAPAQDGG